MVIIGIDPHKCTHTASALDGHPSGHRPLQIEATLAEYRSCCAGRTGSRAAVGGGERRGPGPPPGAVAGRPRRAGRGRARHRHRPGAGAVPRRPPQERRHRRCRGGERGRAAGDATPVPVEDLARCWLLDERRANLAAQRTRLVNQLHALLRELIPGGADTDLTAARAAARAGRRCARLGPVEAARKQLARDLVAEMREVDARPGQAVHPDVASGRRARQPPARGRRHRPGRGGPAARPHRPGRPVPDRVGVRQLCRRRPGRGGQRRPGPASAAPRWGPPAEPGVAHRRAHPGPHAPPAPAAPTTTARSARARRTTRPCAASSGASPTTSGGS